MALSKKPVNGMKDILPAEMEIRDYVTSVIKETYRSFGFTPIETPCMENIANLSNKQGGENEKLIFKILIFIKERHAFATLCIESKTPTHVLQNHNSLTTLEKTKNQDNDYSKSWLFWQGWKESNPPLEFWRLLFYR